LDAACQAAFLAVSIQALIRNKDMDDKMGGKARRESAMLLMTASDPNYIYVKVVSSLSSSDLLAAIKKGVEFILRKDLHPSLRRLTTQ
jgi:hypothetical protein